MKIILENKPNQADIQVLQRGIDQYYYSVLGVKPDEYNNIQGGIYVLV